MKNANKRPTISDYIDIVDDYGQRLEQINCLAKALSSMVGYEAPKGWITLVEMICEKSDVPV